MFRQITDIYIRKKNKLYVNAYKDIFLYLSGLTDFEQKESYLFRKEQMLKTIQHFRYKDVKTAHLKEYVKYFNRTSLTLEIRSLIILY